jgi:hypothetical protein
MKPPRFPTEFISPTAVAAAEPVRIADGIVQNVGIDD